jgi:hypothetical protein
MATIMIIIPSMECAGVEVPKAQTTIIVIAAIIVIVVIAVITVIAVIAVIAVIVTIVIIVVIVVVIVDERLPLTGAVLFLDQSGGANVDLGYHRCACAHMFLPLVHVP